MHVNGQTSMSKSPLIHYITYILKEGYNQPCRKAILLWDFISMCKYCFLYAPYRSAYANCQNLNLPPLAAMIMYVNEHRGRLGQRSPSSKLGPSTAPWLVDWKHCVFFCFKKDILCVSPKRARFSSPKRSRKQGVFVFRKYHVVCPLKGTCCLSPKRVCCLSLK